MTIEQAPVEPTDEEVKDQVSETPVESDADAEEIEAMRKRFVEGQTNLADKGADLAAIAAKNLDVVWTETLTKLLVRMGDTPENIQFLTETTATLQHLLKNLSVNAVQLADMHNYFINGGLPIDMGAKFVMDDYMRGIMNYGFGVLPAVYNVFDPTIPGAEDPRWTYDRLPIKEVVEGQGEVSIPMRIETFKEVMYGRLELFNYQMPTASGRVVTIQTTHPGFRVNQGWITINSIMRWMPCGADVVKNAWLTGKARVAKTPLPDDTDDNPIVDTEGDNGNGNNAK